MKTHIEDEHKGPQNLYHLKMNRDDPIIVDFKCYKSDKIWEEIWEVKLKVKMTENCNIFGFVYVFVSFLGEGSR